MGYSPCSPSSTWHIPRAGGDPGTIRMDICSLPFGRFNSQEMPFPFPSPGNIQRHGRCRSLEDAGNRGRETEAGKGHGWKPALSNRFCPLERGDLSPAMLWRKGGVSLPCPLVSPSPLPTHGLEHPRDKSHLYHYPSRIQCPGLSLMWAGIGSWAGDVRPPRDRKGCDGM